MWVGRTASNFIVSTTAMATLWGGAVTQLGDPRSGDIMIAPNVRARSAGYAMPNKLVVMLRMGFGVCCLLAASETQASAQLGPREPTPEPAIPAIITLLQTYDVVGMRAAHGMKDLDDFILTLVRTPAFA